MYNINDISGSTSYGRAIENLPNLEAVTDDTAMMKYMLTSQPRQTIFQPKIMLDQDCTYTIKDQGQNNKITLNPDTINSSDTSYIYEFYDTSAINVHKGGSGQSFGSTDIDFPAQQDVKSPRRYMSANGIEITAKPTSVQRSVVVGILGGDTGTKTFKEIVINANIKTQAVAKDNAGTAL